jgi:uncharacterized damage-inducible protein DinB
MLAHTKQYFDRSTACLTDEDGDFAPAPGMFTATQQVAHVAQTVDWFMHGAFSPEGFSMDWEGLERKVKAVSSLAEARAWLDRAFANAIATIESKSVEELALPIADGPVLGGEPRTVVVPGIAEHTAHHRGALTVYSRLRKKTPAMPYT